eukprot:TRINITY_DN4397_c0_g1_i1.p3 TRINITY_DN4397_c0_g1~~TRINITY_DN4397_c0_g1_i1.p3  ORF type:complete len:269 (-),score=79.96 TRINITY_DN4397_c0_g1_i1:72-878(-)
MPVHADADVRGAAPDSQGRFGTGILMARGVGAAKSLADHPKFGLIQRKSRLVRQMATGVLALHVHERPALHRRPDLLTHNVGTRGYQAPEVMVEARLSKAKIASGKKDVGLVVDADSQLALYWKQCDVFSFACTCIRFLLGRQPYSVTPPDEAASRAADEPPGVDDDVLEQTLVGSDKINDDELAAFILRYNGIDDFLNLGPAGAQWRDLVAACLAPRAASRPSIESVVEQLDVIMMVEGDNAVDAHDTKIVQEIVADLLDAQGEPYL